MRWWLLATVLLSITSCTFSGAINRASVEKSRWRESIASKDYDKLENSKESANSGVDLPRSFSRRKSITTTPASATVRSRTRATTTGARSEITLIDSHRGEQNIRPTSFSEVNRGNREEGLKRRYSRFQSTSTTSVSEPTTRKFEPYGSPTRRTYTRRRDNKIASTEKPEQNNNEDELVKIRMTTEKPTHYIRRIKQSTNSPNVKTTRDVSLYFDNLGESSSLRPENKTNLVKIVDIEQKIDSNLNHSSLNKSKSFPIDAMRISRKLRYKMISNETETNRPAEPVYIRTKSSTPKSENLNLENVNKSSDVVEKKITSNLTSLHHRANNSTNSARTFQKRGRVSFRPTVDIKSDIISDVHEEDNYPESFKAALLNKNGVPIPSQTNKETLKTNASKKTYKSVNTTPSQTNSTSRFTRYRPQRKEYTKQASKSPAEVETSTKAIVRKHFYPNTAFRKRSSPLLSTFSTVTSSNKDIIEKVTTNYDDVETETLVFDRPNAVKMVSTTEKFGADTTPFDELEEDEQAVDIFSNEVGEFSPPPARKYHATFTTTLPPGTLNEELTGRSQISPVRYTPRPTSYSNKNMADVNNESKPKKFIVNAKPAHKANEIVRSNGRYSSKFRAPLTQKTMLAPSSEMPSTKLDEEDENDEYNHIFVTKTWAPPTALDLKTSETRLTPVINVQTSNHSPSVTVSIFDALAEILTSTPRTFSSTTKTKDKADFIMKMIQTQFQNPSVSNTNTEIITNTYSAPIATSTQASEPATRTVTMTSSFPIMIEKTTTPVITTTTTTLAPTTTTTTMAPTTTTTTLAPTTTTTTLAPTTTTTTPAPTTTTSILTTSTQLTSSTKRKALGTLVLYSTSKPENEPASLDQALPTSMYSSETVPNSNLFISTLPNNISISHELVKKLTNNLINEMQDLDEISRKHVAISMENVLSTLLVKSLDNPSNSDPNTVNAKDIEEPTTLSYRELTTYSDQSTTFVFDPPTTFYYDESTTFLPNDLTTFDLEESETTTIVNDIVDDSQNNTPRQSNDTTAHATLTKARKPKYLSSLRLEDFNNEISQFNHLSVENDGLSSEAVNMSANNNSSTVDNIDYVKTNIFSQNNSLVNMQNNVLSTPFNSNTTFTTPSNHVIISPKKLWSLSKKAEVLKIIEEIIQKHNNEMNSDPETLSGPTTGTELNRLENVQSDFGAAVFSDVMMRAKEFILNHADEKDVRKNVYVSDASPREIQSFVIEDSTATVINTAPTMLSIETVEPKADDYLSTPQTTMKNTVKDENTLDEKFSTTNILLSDFQINKAKITENTERESLNEAPKRDYVIFGILPNNTVVRKNPNDESILEKITESAPYIVYGILPNNTVIRKFPNGTRVPTVDSRVEIVPISPWSLKNPTSSVYQTPIDLKPQSPNSTNCCSTNSLVENVGNTVNTSPDIVISQSINDGDSNKSFQETSQNKVVTKSSHVISLRTTTNFPSIDEILNNSIAKATSEEKILFTMSSSTENTRILTLDIDPETKRVRTEKPIDGIGAVFKFIPVDEVKVEEKGSNVFKFSSVNTKVESSTRPAEIQFQSTTPIKVETTFKTTTVPSITTTTATEPSIITTTTKVTTTSKVPSPTTAFTTIRPTTAEVMSTTLTSKTAGAETTFVLTRPYQEAQAPMTEVNPPQHRPAIRRTTSRYVTSSVHSETSTEMYKPTVFPRRQSLTSRPPETTTQEILITTTTAGVQNLSGRRAPPTRTTTTQSPPSSSTFSVDEDIAFLHNLKKVIGTNADDPDTELANKIIALAVEKSLTDLEGGKKGKSIKIATNQNLPATESPKPRFTSRPTTSATTSTTTSTTTTTTVKPTRGSTLTKKLVFSPIENDPNALQSLLGLTLPNPSITQKQTPFNNDDSAKFSTTPSIEDDIKQFQQDAQLLQVLLKATGQNPSSIKIPSITSVKPTRSSNQVKPSVEDEIKLLQNLLGSPSPLNEPFDSITAQSKPADVDNVESLSVRPLSTTTYRSRYTTLKRTEKTTTNKNRLNLSSGGENTAQHLNNLDTSPQKNKVTLTGLSSEETLKSLLKQIEEKPSVSATKPTIKISTEYGKTNDALLAALLKEQGLGPSTSNSQPEKERLQELLNQVVVTPKIRTTTTLPPKTLPPRRPVLDGLAWLWQQWRETAPGPGPTRAFRRPSDSPPPPMSPTAWFGSGPFIGNADDTTEKRVPLESPVAVSSEQVPMRSQLVSAAINVTRAFSQFLGAAIQGAAQTVQNVIKAGQRAAGQVYPPGTARAGRI